MCVHVCTCVQMENQLLDFHHSNLEFACGASLDKVGRAGDALTIIIC